MAKCKGVTDGYTKYVHFVHPHNIGMAVGQGKCSLLRGRWTAISCDYALFNSSTYLQSTGCAATIMLTGQDLSELFENLNWGPTYNWDSVMSLSVSKWASACLIFLLYCIGLLQVTCASEYICVLFILYFLCYRAG